MARSQAGKQALGKIVQESGVSESAVVKVLAALGSTDSGGEAIEEATRLHEQNNPKTEEDQKASMQEAVDKGSADLKPSATPDSESPKPSSDEFRVGDKREGPLG